MAIFERGAGAFVAERVMVADGSAEQSEYERLVEDGGNWRRVDADTAEEESTPDGMPKKSAKQEAWVEWAVKQGAVLDEVKDLKRDELIVKYGGE
jgi:hypothetical protein